MHINHSQSTYLRKLPTVQNFKVKDNVYGRDSDWNNPIGFVKGQDPATIKEAAGRRSTTREIFRLFADNK